MSPKVFFALAPLLLLTLYLHVVVAERMLARTASVIITRSASRSVAPEVRALRIPVLEMARVRFLPAHVPFLLMLCFAPFLSGKWRLPFVILLVVVGGWFVWGLVAFLQHRRQTPKTSEPPRREDAGTATEKPTVETSAEGSCGDHATDDGASAKDGDTQEQAESWR